MSISALSAAQYLCGLEGASETNLSINKKVYVAHMAFTGVSGGQLLIEEKFQAWDYGPVVPDLYEALKEFGAAPVDVSDLDAPVVKDSAMLRYLDWAHSALKTMSPWVLVDYTHSDQGAWKRVYRPGVFGIEIPNDYIVQEYRVRSGVQSGS